MEHGKQNNTRYSNAYKYFNQNKIKDKSIINVSESISENRGN